MADSLQEKWQARIARAKKAKEEWEGRFRVRMGRDYFEGKQNPGYPEEEWISIPKIYSHLQAQLPTLYSVNPYFYIKMKKSYHEMSAEELQEFQRTGKPPPSVAVSEQKARGRQAMLNYLKEELELKESARLGIQDAHFAFGVIKVRRASDQEEHPHAGEPILDDNKEEMKDPKTGKTLVFPDTLPTNERYEICRVHPDDLLFDADAGPLKWGWVAQHETMSKADALKDPRFNKSVVKRLKGKTVKGDKEKGPIMNAVSKAFGGEPNPDDDDIFLDVWEVYDHKKQEMLCLEENADELLMKPRSLPPGIEKDPFAVLRFTLRDNSPYPIPPVSPAIDPQKEISLSRSRRVTHRKRFNRKYEAYTPGMDDAANELAKLESGGDGTVIQKNTPQQVITPIQDAPLDQQEVQELMFLNNDCNEALGSPDQSRGIANADSATEASILDTRAEVKEGDRLSMVVDWITLVARKLDMLVQAHIDANEMVKVTGPQGEFWHYVQKADYEEIKGEYQYSVNTGASQARLPDIERAQLMAFFSQVVIPFPAILTSPATMRKMAELFHIEDEAMIEELRQLGIKMIQGVIPMPGQQGGGPEGGSPVAQVIGAALGQSGGNVNGGGAPARLQ